MCMPNQKLRAYRTLHWFSTQVYIASRNKESCAVSKTLDLIRTCSLVWINFNWEPILFPVLAFLLEKKKSEERIITTVSGLRFQTFQIYQIEFIPSTPIPTILRTTPTSGKNECKWNNNNNNKHPPRWWWIG